jgi:Tfp pilus assembly protein PilO
MKDGRGIWFCAVLVLLAGYACIFRVDEGRIEDRTAENAAIVGQLAADEARIRRRPELEAERVSLQERLRAVDLEADRTHLVAVFLRDAARIAARHHARISAVVAESDGASSPAAHPPFQGIPLELTIEGRYADILAAIRDLSASRVLAGVEVASLTRKQTDLSRTTLTSAVRVVIEYLAPGGVPHVLSRHA